MDVISRLPEAVRHFAGLSLCRIERCVINIRGKSALLLRLGDWRVARKNN